MVRLLFANVGRPNARQDGHRGFGHASCYRNQPSRRQQGLHIEATETLPRISGLVIKKNTDPSCSSGDLGNVAGPGPTDHRGCGYRRRERATNLFIHVCADERGDVRALHNGLTTLI